MPTFTRPLWIKTLAAALLVIAAVSTTRLYFYPYTSNALPNFYNDATYPLQTKDADMFLKNSSQIFSPQFYNEQTSLSRSTGMTNYHPTCDELVTKMAIEFSYIMYEYESEAKTLLERHNLCREEYEQANYKVISTEEELNYRLRELEQMQILKESAYQQLLKKEYMLKET